MNQNIKVAKELIKLAKELNAGIEHFGEIQTEEVRKGFEQNINKVQNRFNFIDADKVIEFCNTFIPQLILNASNRKTAQFEEEIQKKIRGDISLIFRAYQAANPKTFNSK